MRAHPLLILVAGASLSTTELAAQCAESIDVACPARNEVTLAAGVSTLATTVAVAWTSPRRIGAYVRTFPTLQSTPASRADAVVTAEEAQEFGVTYRVRTALTLGVGYVRRGTTERTYGPLDLVTFRPTLIDIVESEKRGPSVFLAYAFHPPTRQIGFALSLSAGVVGSGAAIGTTLRFPVRVTSSVPPPSDP